MEEENINYTWFDESAKQLADKLYMPSINKKPLKHTTNGILYETYNYYKPLDLDFKENTNYSVLNIKNSIKKYNTKSKKLINKHLSLDKFDYAINELAKKLKKEVNNSDKIIKCYKYQIDFTNEQKNILNVWFNECDKVYNKCVELYNINSKDFNLNYKKSKIKIFQSIYGDNKKTAPYDILTDEVRIFCSNIKSCLTNLTNKNIKHFTITERNNKKQKSILIPKKSITNNGIFINILGKIKDFDKKINIDNIICDSRLIYNKDHNKYYLCIPEYQSMKNIFNRKPVVALDPGEKNFMTFYSLDEYGKIGINLREPILKLRTRISKYQRAIKKQVNKNKSKLKNKRKLKKKINNKYKKIKNIVKELHNQTALNLCKKYDKILLPIFETRKMVFSKDDRVKKIKENIQKIKEESKTDQEITIKIKEYRKRRKLNKKSKFVLNNLSHYKFKQHILNKGKEYGCDIIIVGEEYTSQACGKCGQLSKTYINRIKECESCHHKIDRDINGARNILIKNHREVIN
jgi:putative transposase